MGQARLRNVSLLEIENKAASSLDSIEVVYFYQNYG